MRAGARWRQVSALPPVAGDVALVVVFAVIAVLEHHSADRYQAGPLWLNVLLTGAVVLLLGLRRLAPVAVLVLTCLVLTVPSAFVHHDFLVWTHSLPVAIEVYTVARRRRVAVAMGAGLLALVSMELVLLVDVADGGGGGVLLVLILGPAVAGGVVMRRQAAQRAAIADALARLELEGETRERLALLTERTRVARDLHDVVAHAVSIMVVSAQRASTALDRDPEGAEQAVRTLESAGRSATAELRRMLGLLRSPTAEADPGEPAPGLAALDTLVARMREAGLTITVTEHGERPDLPPGFEVAVYRIVQEALTNVLQHAGPTAVDLRLDHTPLSVEVVDAGPRSHAAVARRSEAGSEASTEARTGHGLLGMQERVALLGGDLRVGPEGQGYAVRVRLPLPVPA